jgi:hypothetical protein
MSGVQWSIMEKYCTFCIAGIMDKVTMPGNLHVKSNGAMKFIWWQLFSLPTKHYPWSCINESNCTRNFICFGKLSMLSWYHVWKSQGIQHSFQLWQHIFQKHLLLYEVCKHWQFYAYLHTNKEFSPHFVTERHAKDTDVFEMYRHEQLQSFQQDNALVFMA